MRREGQRSARSLVDWHELRRRLDAALLYTEEALHPGPERGRRLMEERCRALARPLTRPHSGEVLEVLVFEVGGERYAIEARLARDVQPFAAAARVPLAPASLLGLTVVRTEVVPLFDLRGLIGRSVDAADPAWVVVLADGRPPLALAVDTVQAPSALRRDEIYPPPPRASTAGSPYVRGVTQDGVTVLEGPALLSVPPPFSPPTARAKDVREP